MDGRVCGYLDPRHHLRVHRVRQLTRGGGTRKVRGGTLMELEKEWGPTSPGSCCR
jgi:hypothetical protein